MIDNNEAMKLAELIGGRVSEILMQQAERIAELESECNQLRVNSERYNVLRCYELGGSWPDAFKAPAGLLAFSRGLTQHELDKVLDDMLGYIPHPTPESVRSDYQQWIRKNTLARIEQVKHNG